MPPDEDAGAEDREIDMHPLIVHDLARIKMAEQHEYAERERRARLVAGVTERHAIDFSALLSRIKVRIARASAALPERPATSGT